MARWGDSTMAEGRCHGSAGLGYATRTARLTTDQEASLRVIERLLPGFDDLVAHMESRDGWLSLQEIFADGLIRSGLHWWEFYEDADRLKALALLGTFGVAAVQGLVESTPASDVRVAVLRLMEEDLTGSDAAATPGDGDIRAWLANSATAGEQVASASSVGLLLLATVSNLFNTLAMMVHGQSLTTLVARAKAGDDGALCRAVQIDRTILFLPFAQARLIRAQFGRGDSFLSDLGYRLRNPTLRSKIRQRKLWLAIALLDEEGLLGLVPRAAVRSLSGAGRIRPSPRYRGRRLAVEAAAGVSALPGDVKEFFASLRSPRDLHSVCSRSGRMVCPPQ